MSTPGSTTQRPQVIALEEHYFDAELSSLFEGYEAQPKMGKRLLDMAQELRRLTATQPAKSGQRRTE